jgi:hypothetical protein
MLLTSPLLFPGEISEILVKALLFFAQSPIFLGERPAKPMNSLLSVSVKMWRPT